MCEARGEEVWCAFQEGEEVIMLKRLVPFLLALCIPLFSSAPALATFALTTFSINAENQDGSSDVQAGSHPYALTTNFMLNEEPLPAPLENSPKDVQVELPPGFFGDPHATPRCAYSAFSVNKCPPNTQVGTEITYLVRDREVGEYSPPFRAGRLGLQYRTVVRCRGGVRLPGSGDHRDRSCWMSRFARVGTTG